MRVRVFVALAMIVSTPLQFGCSIVEKVYDSRPPDYVDGTEFGGDDSWTATAGKEGRGNRARQTDPDSYWGRLFMTPKARDIENNLGIDHKR